MQKCKANFYFYFFIFYKNRLSYRPSIVIQVGNLEAFVSEKRTQGRTEKRREAFVSVLHCHSTTAKHKECYNKKSSRRV